MSVVFEVGSSPSRLVEYEPNCLPGSFVHPVPLRYELQACFIYKKKASLLYKSLWHLNHLTSVINKSHRRKIFNSHIKTEILKLMGDASAVLKGASRLCKIYKLFPRKILRNLAIMAVNKYRITKFKVYRLVDWIIGPLASQYKLSNIQYRLLAICLLPRLANNL